MATRKNHHFVPQFYFRRFSSDGRSICALMRGTGHVVRRASIKGQASKDWFYGSVEAESALSEIEGHCSAALRELAALKDPTQLSAEHIEGLLIHLTLQRSRTEAARVAGQPIHDKMAQLVVEMGASNADGLSDDQRALILDNLDSWQADPVAAQGLEMATAMQSAEALSDLRPLLLVNTTNRPFIFGDAPVVFYNPYCRDVTLRGVLGFASPGLLVILPLDSRTCFLLVDAEVYRVRASANNRVSVRDLRDVAALNKLQLHAASGCVYFEEERFSGYVKALWAEEHKRLTKHAGSVAQAPGFDAQTREPLGEIVHAFQPQLAYRPLLSFLKHEIVGDGDQRLLRRAGAQYDESPIEFP